MPADQAAKVVDVSGLYVTPGLIDIHYHIGHGGAPLNWFAPDSPDLEVPLATASLTTSPRLQLAPLGVPDRKSTRLNSSHLVISYAVFCLKKKKKYTITHPL